MLYALSMDDNEELYRTRAVVEFLCIETSTVLSGPALPFQ